MNDGKILCLFDHCHVRGPVMSTKLVGYRMILNIYMVNIMLLSRFHVKPHNHQKGGGNLMER